jgi:hypothetical protein
MDYILNNGYNFDKAYNELTEKYDSPGLVMKAYNSHLLQTHQVREGDFYAFFF